jgi:uncharacterized protein YlxW (UPF0749 family)
MTVAGAGSVLVVLAAAGGFAAGNQQGGDRAGAAEERSAELASEVKSLREDVSEAKNTAREAEDDLASVAAQYEQTLQAMESQQAELAAREQAVAVAEAKKAASTFPGDGVYLVGDDVQPGTYKSEGGTACYWERQSADGDIIDNYIGSGPTVVTIAPSDFSIEVNNCASFTLRT